MSAQTASVTGIGQTAFTKASGKTVLALCAEASLAAIADAGLTPDDCPSSEHLAQLAA